MRRSEHWIGSAGGRIVDIIQASNGTAEIRGYVPSTDSFSSDTTTVQLSTKSCNLQTACTASTLAQNGPACNMYPVDMTFAGNVIGLVTDRYTTSLARHGSMQYFLQFLRLPISLPSLRGAMLGFGRIKGSCTLHMDIIACFQLIVTGRYLT